MFRDEFKGRCLIIIGLLLTVGLALACGGGGGGDKGEETTGKVSGTVTGSGGLANVTVSTDKGDHTTTTDSSGNYTLSGVEPNTYTLRASLNNYDTETAIDKVVTAGSTTTQNLTLSTFNDKPYVGSVRCKVCHNAYYQSWKDTLHTKKLRYPTDEPGVVADSDSDGTDDFKESLNLSTDSSFSAYGSNAPILGYSDGNYTVRIGQVTYTVNKTIGGHWKQRYMIQQGNSHYILPIQYNVNANDWTVYNGSDWYDSSNLPIYGTNNTFVSMANQADAYERRCGGCHVTAYEPEYLTASSEWEHNYVEMSIGCETCHGPGGKHIVTLNKDDITNPDTDLATDLANQVCGRCHSRGTGETAAGASSAYEYPYDATQGRIFKPGDTLTDFYTYTTSTDAYWGLDFLSSTYLINSTNVVGKNFVSAKEHRQQFLDLYNGPHAAAGLSCFSCHDPHSETQEEQIITSRTDNDDDNITIQTSVDNNTLCLSCHAEDSPFASVTNEMVRDVASDTVSDTLKNAVLDHMGEEAVMRDEDEITYDPEGTGVGRCTKCHMPKTAKTAANWDDDAAGFDKGQIHSHTFRAIFPNVNRILGLTMTNSCTECHTTTESHFKEAWQWSISGHADLSASHYKYATGSTRTSCVRCHSGEGFVDSIADGVGGKSDSTEEATFRTEYKLHSCYTCHDPTASSPTARRSIPTVKFPSDVTKTQAELGDSALCISCHQYRTAGATAVADAIASRNSGGSFSTVAGKVNPHYRGGAAMLYGSGVDGGYQYTGKTYSSGITAHKTTLCVGCHMADASSNNVGGHTWAMHTADESELNNAICATCHTGGVTSFDTFRSGSAGKDYDGDGNSTEGIQEEIAGLKTALLNQLSTLGITSSTSYPYWSGTAWVDKAIKGAYSYNFVDHDPGAGIHNGAYAIQLLRDSIEDISGSTPAGVRP